MISPAIYALCFAHQALHADTDAGGVDSQPLLNIVGAQHDNKQINDLVAFQQRIENCESVHGFMEGVGEDSGAAGQALLCYQKVGTQGFLEQTGPPLVLVEAYAAVGAVGGIGAVAVGIGISKTEYVLFHSTLSFLTVINHRILLG